MRTRARYTLLISLTLAATAVAAYGAGASVGGLSTSTASAITPGATLDQSNPYRPPACIFKGWTGPYPTSWQAQTFTAGRTGTLTDVVLSLWGNTTPITVAIAPVDANGQPLVATPLASTSLAFSPTTTPTDTAVFFSAPATVQAGKQYAIVLSAPNENAPSGGDGGIFVAWAADDGSSVKDPSGTPCADGAYAPGRAWGLDTGSTPNAVGADSDLFFQTYVLAPPPVTVPPARRVSISVTVRGKGRVTGAGISCPARCQTTIASGGELTLRASAARGYRFAGWGGACTGLHVSCTLHPKTPVKVVATFRKRHS
jgi:hypothetical protein